MLILKQSTAVTVQFGPFVDKTDGVTLEVGLATAMDNATTGIRVSKNGAAFADRNSSTAPSYDAMGCYRVELDATDTNTLGTLKIIFEEAATCLPVWMEFMVVTANAYDTLCSTDQWDVNVTNVAGQTASAAATVDFGDLATIEAVTTAIGATGTGLSAIPWNASWDAEVQSECTDAINALFTFTVAGFADANIQYVNDVAVTGTGAAGDEWGP